MRNRVAVAKSNAQNSQSVVIKCKADWGPKVQTPPPLPAVFQDAFYFVPPPGGSRGRVWTVVFLQKLGFWAGSGEVDFNFNFDLIWVALLDGF